MKNKDKYTRLPDIEVWDFLKEDGKVVFSGRDKITRIAELMQVSKPAVYRRLNEPNNILWDGRFRIRALSKDNWWMSRISHPLETRITPSRRYEIKPLYGDESTIIKCRYLKDIWEHTGVDKRSILKAYDPKGFLIFRWWLVRPFTDIEWPTYSNPIEYYEKKFNKTRAIVMYKRGSIKALFMNMGELAQYLEMSPVYLGRKLRVRLRADGYSFDFATDYVDRYPDQLDELNKFLRDRLVNEQSRADSKIR